jgi:heptosyltransferase-3
LNVLIIRPGALGDTLMLLPALTDLSNRVTVTFVGREPGLGFIRPWVHCAMDMERSGWHRLFTNRKDGEGLPVSKAEIAAAFFSDQDGVIRNNLRSFLPDATVHLFRFLPPERENVHVARYLAECLKSAGLPVDPVRSIEAIQSGILSKKYGLSQRRNKIVLHPGSGSLEKNHPPEFWSNLFKRLCSEIDLGRLKPVFLLGPAEESLHVYFKDRLQPNDIQIIFCPEKDRLIKTFNETALYLGHDSGITHLSAMHGTPTVALFKKSNAIQWGPLGPNVTVIQNKKPGRELIDSILKASRDFLGMPG